MPRKFQRTAVFVALAVSPFLLPALPNGWGGSLRGTFLGWTRPLFETVRVVREGFSGIGTGVLDIFSLEEENRILRSRLEALLAHEETHRELFRENARLRELLEFRAKAGWKVMPAEVIGRELGPWSRGLLLDKGSEQGIHPGMAVITSVGLIGRIITNEFFNTGNGDQNQDDLEDTGKAYIFLNPVSPLEAFDPCYPLVSSGARGCTSRRAFAETAGTP